jgi:hypothetical protein
MQLPLFIELGLGSQKYERQDALLKHALRSGPLMGPVSLSKNETVSCRQLYRRFSAVGVGAAVVGCCAALTKGFPRRLGFDSASVAAGMSRESQYTV